MAVTFTNPTDLRGASAARTLDPDRRTLAQTLVDDTATALLQEHDHSAAHRSSTTPV